MCWRLFLTFLKIGAFTFGGGYAMISIIEHEVINRRRWIARPDFLDLLTLAQSAPGPISLNTAVFVGYRLRGLRGALSAILGAVIPSFVIILCVAILFTDVRHNPWVDAAFRGMRPAVVALIVAPILSLSRGMHAVLYLVIVASAVSVWWLGWSPIYILMAAAAGGIGWQLWISKRCKR
ncbi:MAG: chromate transporter [Rikenellaceae bacterium]|nr:chromate transporter [Rikenellaceae bacterium]